MFVLKALCSAAKPCGHFVDKQWPSWDSWPSLKMIKSRWLSHCMELAVCFGHFSPTTETGHRCSLNHTQGQLKSSKKTYTAKKKEKHILQALLALCHIAQNNGSFRLSQSGNSLPHWRPLAATPSDMSGVAASLSISISMWQSWNGGSNAVSWQVRQLFGHVQLLKTPIPIIFLFRTREKIKRAHTHRNLLKTPSTNHWCQSSVQLCRCRNGFSNIGGMYRVGEA